MARIMAIDDSEAFRIEIKDILSHHEVVEAVDGLDALSLLEKDPHFDLIICDVNMPNMDGIEFSKAKFEKKLIAEIPIIMITTESNLELKKTAKKFGVRAWVLKPIDPQSLQQGVAALLGRAQAQKNSPSQVA